jgi:uncharacterized membrane protein
VPVGYLSAVAHDVVGVVRDHKGWMGSNLVLALIPLGFALALFPHRDRRSVGWWIGVAAFAAFLPNAPYVVTDLVHLRGDIQAATGHSTVLAGILPLYAAFIAIGYLGYVGCVELVVREVHTSRPQAPRWAIVVTIHLACSVGIILGRVARLNSWDTITSPRTTVERTFAALAWKGAPASTVAVFVAVTITYWAVRTLAVGVGRGAARVVDALAPGPEPA